jgi:hypothetical protein
MPSKREPKKPGFSIFGSNDPTKGDSPPIVDNNPDFDPLDDELFDDNTKKKKFTNITQCIIDLCDFPSDSLVVEYITNKAWSTLNDVTKIMIDKDDNVCINKRDGLFEAKPMKLHLCKLQCCLIFYNSKSCNMYGPLDEEDVIGICLENTVPHLFQLT